VLQHSDGKTQKRSPSLRLLPKGLLSRAALCRGLLSRAMRRLLNRLQLRRDRVAAKGSASPRSRGAANTDDEAAGLRLRSKVASQS